MATLAPGWTCAVATYYVPWCPLYGSADHYYFQQTKHRGVDDDNGGDMDDMKNL